MVKITLKHYIKLTILFYSNLIFEKIKKNRTIYLLHIGFVCTWALRLRCSEKLKEIKIL
jgi:hypothetical protein